jgi:C-terminal processing protease CtpA/Prc
VFSSGFRLRLVFALACLLCGIAASSAASADEGDDLASAIVAHIHGRLPASAAALTPADENRVTSFTHYILKTFYYPANVRELQAGALAAIDATEQPADASALAQSAMTGVVNSLGHGARFLTTIGADYFEPGSSGGPSTHDVSSLRIVTLPTMNVTDPNVRRTCADFVRYFDLKSTDDISGFVLDLRGNEGGPLTDSSCLVGFFIKSGQTLFQTITKQGMLAKYESEATGHKPTNLPVAVLIDNRTDSGALLVAAMLQSNRHAAVIGEEKPAVNGGVSSLVFPPGANRGVVLPTGEILLEDKRPLSAGIHVDIAVPAQDDTALLNAARTYLATQKKK